MNEDDDARTVWIGNLSQKVTEELLYELFLQAAPLQRVKIPKDKEGKQCNYGFVTFKHQCSVPYAIQLLNGVSLQNQQLNIKPRNVNSRHINSNNSEQQQFSEPPLYSSSSQNKNDSNNYAKSRSHDFNDRRNHSQSPYSRPHGSSRENYHGRPNNRYDNTRYDNNRFDNNRYDNNKYDRYNNSGNNERDYGRRKNKRR